MFILEYLSSALRFRRDDVVAIRLSRRCWAETFRVFCGDTTCRVQSFSAVWQSVHACEAPICIPRCVGDTCNLSQSLWRICVEAERWILTIQLGMIKRSISYSTTILYCVVIQLYL